MVNHNQTEAEQPEMVTTGLHSTAREGVIIADSNFYQPPDVILTSRMAVGEMVDHDHKPFKKDLLDRHFWGK